MISIVKRIFVAGVIMMNLSALAEAYEVSSTDRTFLVLPSVAVTPNCLPQSYSKMMPLEQALRGAKSYKEIVYARQTMGNADVSKVIVIDPNGKTGTQRCAFMLADNTTIEVDLKYTKSAKQPRVSVTRSNKTNTIKKIQNDDLSVIREYFKNQSPRGYYSISQGRKVDFYCSNKKHKHEYRVISVLSNQTNRMIWEIVAVNNKDIEKLNVSNLNRVYASTVVKGKKSSRIIVLTSEDMSAVELKGYLP
ncbi:hypothetical protein [Halobacteriovorax sp. ZH2_bin.1]|uniref:hypothetical protein n=1 Tax=Halobacteriovorax sp. ZH2_bin.1 TaxID=3157724 RepID=UPI00371DAFC6